MTFMAVVQVQRARVCVCVFLWVTCATGTVAADEIGNNPSGVHKHPYSPRHLCDSKSGTCLQKWLNNLEPITSRQAIKGAAQSDYSRYSFAATVVSAVCEL